MLRTYRQALVGMKPGGKIYKSPRLRKAVKVHPDLSAQVCQHAVLIDFDFVLVLVLAVVAIAFPADLVER